MSNKISIGNIISWVFGVVVSAIGLVNMFWGNDAMFGVFIFLLAFVYFPPVTTLVKKKLHLSLPLIVKIILAVFILWASVGVGELFAKIDLMMMDL